MKNTAIKLLVLDDEPFILKLLARMLANLGYSRVVTCDNGLAALDLIKNPVECPELILLDINMPGMDGIEFMRHLVEQRFTGSLILISGEDERMQLSAEKLADAYKIKVLGHLQKPATPEKLSTLIDLFTPALHALVPAEKTYDAKALRQAIDNGELVNYYQPIVMTSNGRVAGVETLVRWQHPTDGIVLPAQFITIAEENGLINDLTRVVLQNAFTQAQRWQDSRLMLHISVNLSIDNLSSFGFMDLMIELAANSGFPPQMMTLELTESRLMQDLRTPLEILSRLRLKRFHISIDNFGIGNSSLAQLRDIPFDELKIDQSFVHGAGHNEKLSSMFDASFGLAKQLKMDVVAKGIENQSDWNFVRSRSCDMAQGNFIAQPMPAADIATWIQSWQLTYQQTNKRI